MSLNIEFTCGLDDIDTQDLIITDENIYDYSSFSFILKNSSSSIETYFSADSIYISLEEISNFIEKLSNYENEIVGDLFHNTDYYSISLYRGMKLIFSVCNFKEGFSGASFALKLNRENIQDVLSVFNKLYDFKKKLEDSYERDYSDIEDYEEEVVNLNQEVNFF